MRLALRFILLVLTMSSLASRASASCVYDPGSGSGAGAKTVYQVFSRVTGGLVYRDEATDGETTDYAAVGGAALRLKKTGAALTPEYTHFDHQGSGVAATNASGAILWRERYSPWGTRLLKPAGNKGDTGYTGHLMDAATELVYMQARYYDSQIQRFYSTDPVGYEDQLNLYAYVGNDPVNKTDPTGMCSTGSRLGENSGCKIDFDSAVAEKNAEARANSAQTQGTNGGSGQNSESSAGATEAPGSAAGAANGPYTGDDSIDSLIEPDLFLLAIPIPIAGMAARLGLAAGKSPSIGSKVAGQMGPRGWTLAAIREAKASGQQIKAINKANGNAATRYVHPQTTQSVVIDDVTGEVIHVGGQGFKYGPTSGDVP